MTDWKAGELALTYNRTEPDGPKITMSTELLSTVRPFYEECMEVREKFMVVGLSRDNHVRSLFEVSAGGCAACVVDPKILFSRLLLDNCASFVCVHNHPSGNLTPSLSDKNLTKTLNDAGKVLDIKLLDHVILTAKDHLSFADIGLL